jgi:S1-C subfamily serine protease
VRIEAYRGGEIHSHSTGYIIGGKYVTTCNHCVKDADKFVATIKFRQGTANFHKNIELILVNSSEEGDCAILAIKDSFENGASYPSLLLAPENTVCSLQQKVFSAGYPLGIKDLQLHTPSKIVGMNDGYILFEAQAIHQGDSGAPIINSDGLVIGYLCGSINRSQSGVHAPSETNRFAHTDNIYRLIEKIKTAESN